MKQNKYNPDGTKSDGVGKQARVYIKVNTTMNRHMRRKMAAIRRKEKK